ncbi:MAG TPA: pyridoxal-dependent decarboxylase [Cyanobacteria bacterium UBA9579]|nr:pyridoxal-dependent decarboxylase [Cyanobacteria bacterium UBA9579]
MVKKVISQSNHLHHPGYIGRQVSTPLPAAALSELISSFLNNSSVVFEMGPVNTVMEKSIINWMAKLIGFDSHSDGFLTSGGTLGNLTVLLAARQSKTGYDIWKEGIKDSEPISFMVSEQAHYSIKQAIQVMGLGENGIIRVPVDENHSMDINALESKYQEALNSGRKVIAVVGNACTTKTGSYDPLDRIADFCEKHDLWFHVDGAHGASALISNKYKHLLKGIERADSIIWDAHKMLLMPALITAVIFKKSSHSYEAFGQKASYIFEKEWYNLAHRTMECTKTMMSLKLYLSLSTYGTDYFSSYVTQMYDTANKFGEILEKAPDFELAIKPQSNIICFRYTPQGANDVEELQKKIRKGIHDREAFYLAKTRLKNQTYLRCIIINPMTTEYDLLNLLDAIRNVA